MTRTRKTCEGSLDVARQVINRRGVYWYCIECGAEVEVGLDGQSVYALRHLPGGDKLTRPNESDRGTWDSIDLFYSDDFAARVGVAS